MSDSRNLKTKEELEVQEGKLNVAYFSRVEGDDKYYWMKLSDKSRASKKNVFYYNSLGMTVLSSPITTCFENANTKNCLKIEIDFLHTLFGQQLEDSYSVKNIFDKTKSIKQNNLISTLAKAARADSREVIPHTERTSSNLKTKEELEVQKSKLKLECFSRVEGDDKYYWMKLIDAHRASKRNIVCYKSLGMTALSSPITTCFENADTKNCLKIEIDFLHTLFGQQLADSYLVKSIFDKNKNKKQNNLISTLAKEVLPADHEVIPHTKRTSSNLKSIKDLEPQDGTLQSVFTRVVEDNEFYWMKLIWRTAAWLKRDFNAAFQIHDSADSPIIVSKQYIKVKIFFLQQVFGSELEDSYSVKEISSEVKMKGKIIDDSSSQRVTPNTQQLITSKEKLEPQDGTLQSVFTRIAEDHEFYWMKLLFKTASRFKVQFGEVFNMGSDSQIKPSTQEYLKVKIYFLQQVFGSNLKDSYSVNEISAEIKRSAQHKDKKRISSENDTLPQTPHYMRILDEKTDTLDLIQSTLASEVGNQENLSFEEVMLPASTENGFGGPCLDQEDIDLLAYLSSGQLNEYLKFFEENPYFSHPTDPAFNATPYVEPQETLNSTCSVQEIQEILEEPKSRAPEVGTQVGQIEKIFSASQNTFFVPSLKQKLPPEKSQSQSQLDEDIASFIESGENQTEKRERTETSNPISSDLEEHTSKKARFGA